MQPTNSKLTQVLMVLSADYSENVPLADVQAYLLVRQHGAPQKQNDEFFKELGK